MLYPKLWTGQRSIHDIAKICNYSVYSGLGNKTNYHTSYKFSMLISHRPEGENSYYHPAIISLSHAHKICAYSSFFLNVLSQ